jgi:DNA-directed RNA polymerase specialized sigma24 family protein
MSPAPPAPPAPPGATDPPLPHDDDRCARLYEACKVPGVAFARRLLAPSYGRNRYLCAFDAEEFYDLAWETYYERREYLAVRDRDEHVRRLNALILSRVRDERRRAGARKREALSRAVGLEHAEPDGGPDAEGTGPASGRGRGRVGSAAGRLGTVPGMDDQVADRVADREELRWLLAQVRNPDDARALYHHEVEGRTFEEIGAREGITAEAARRRALRAKQQARAGREAEQ